MDEKESNKVKPPGDVTNIFDDPKAQEKAQKSGDQVEIQDMHIAQKILCVIKELGPIEKQGKNAAQKYAYTKEVDVKKAVKPLFNKYGLIAIPSAENKEFIQAENKKGTIIFMTNIDFTLTLINVHDPKEQIQVKLPASGMDYGGDKGPYKAITGGLKAALIALLLIETDHGNDPEEDHNDGKKPSSSSMVIPEDIQKLAKSMGHKDKSKVLEIAKHLNNDWVEVAKMLKKAAEEQAGGS